MIYDSVIAGGVRRVMISSADGSRRSHIQKLFVSRITIFCIIDKWAWWMLVFEMYKGMTIPLWTVSWTFLKWIWDLRDERRWLKLMSKSQFNNNILFGNEHPHTWLDHIASGIHRYIFNDLRGTVFTNDPQTRTYRSWFDHLSLTDRKFTDQLIKAWNTVPPCIAVILIDSRRSVMQIRSSLIHRKRYDPVIHPLIIYLERIGCIGRSITYDVKYVYPRH